MYFNELKVGMAIELATASIDKGRVECGTTLFKCRTQNAECRTTSLHYVSLTRKDYISAECGTRSAERLHYTTFRSQGKNV